MKLKSHSEANTFNIPASPNFHTFCQTHTLPLTCTPPSPTMTQVTLRNIRPLPPHALLQAPQGPASTKYLTPPVPETFLGLEDEILGETPGPPRGVTEPEGGRRPMRP